MTYLQVVLQFLLDYPVKKTLNKHLNFFLDNLEYEVDSGRESMFEMIGAILTSFPQVISLSTPLLLATPLLLSAPLLLSTTVLSTALLSTPLRFPPSRPPYILPSVPPSLLPSVPP